MLKGTVSVISSDPSAMQRGQCPIHNGTLEPVDWAHVQKVELQKVELQKVEWQKVELQKVEQSKGRTIKR